MIFHVIIQTVISVIMLSIGGQSVWLSVWLLHSLVSGGR